MDNFSPRQLILTVIVVSVATSLLVTIVAISFLTGAKPSQVVEGIREQIPGSRLPASSVAERMLSQEELVVRVVHTAVPAVVSIVASKDVPVVERFFVNPFEGDSFFEQFFGDGRFRVPQFRQRGTQKQEIGAGTGFIVSADGLILTNKHVVADAGAEYTVFFGDDTKLPARVLGRDPAQDLAVLKVDLPRNAPRAVVTLGDSSQVEIGQTVIAIGNALGEFSNTVSVGVVSGLHRSVVAAGGAGGPEELEELIQTDAAINPGNSGGPLLNLRGEVVAINVAMAQGAENIGFAIPINRAKRDIESVKSSGRIIYPFLGVRYVLVTKDIMAAEKLPVDFGALIVAGESEPAVVKGSPAEQAGLRAGDIILEFNGERIEPTRTLAALIQKYQVGDTVTLSVRRARDTLSISVTLEERK